MIPTMEHICGYLCGQNATPKTKVRPARTRQKQQA